MGRLRCGVHTPKRLSEAISVPKMGFLILLDEHRRPHSHIIEGIGAYDTILPPTGIYPYMYDVNELTLRLALPLTFSKYIFVILNARCGLCPKNLWFLSQP